MFDEDDGVGDLLTGAGRSPAEDPDGRTTEAAATTPSEAVPSPGSLPFDVALAQLQDVVGRLEKGGLPLEESIALYERGVALHDQCARLLTDAELRVQRLLEQAGGALRTMDLDPDAEV